MDFRRTVERVLFRHHSIRRIAKQFKSMRPISQLSCVLDWSLTQRIVCVWSSSREINVRAWWWKCLFSRERLSQWIWIQRILVRRLARTKCNSRSEVSDSITDWAVPLVSGTGRLRNSDQKLALRVRNSTYSKLGFDTCLFELKTWLPNSKKARRIRNFGSAFESDVDVSNSAQVSNSVSSDYEVWPTTVQG